MWFNALERCWYVLCYQLLHWHFVICRCGFQLMHEKWSPPYLWISHFLTFSRTCVCNFLICQNVTCSIKSPILIIWLHDQGSTSRKIDQLFFWNRHYSGLIAGMIGNIKDVASSKVNKIIDFWSIYVRDINSKISS